MSQPTMSKKVAAAIEDLKHMARLHRTNGDTAAAEEFEGFGVVVSQLVAEAGQLKHDGAKWEDLYRAEHANCTRVLDTLTGFRNERDQLKDENEELRAQIQRSQIVELANFDWDAEMTALRKDAERYRWLRMASHFDTPQHQVFCKAYGDALDGEIDAAMSKEAAHGA